MRNHQQLSHFQAPLRKNSSGRVQPPILNQDLLEVSTERYARKKSDNTCDIGFAQSIDIQNTEQIQDLKENNYQEILAVDDIDKLITEREEITQDKSIDDEMKKSFKDALDSLQQDNVLINGKQVVNTEDCQQNKQLEQITTVQKQQKYLYYVYGGNYPEAVYNALKARGNWQETKEEDNIEKCHFLWKPVNYQPEGYKRIDKRIVRSNNIFIFNHLEVLKGLTTKSGLVRSLKQYYFNNDQARQAGYSIFDSTPTTFLLASGVEDSEYTEMAYRYKDFQRGYAPKERIPIKHCVNNIWLVKPSNANQGKGIEIFSDLDDLQTFVASRPQFTCCVVQKYIERPLLFKGRKFDIRVWALFTSKNEVFLYKDGYLRTSSDDYDLENGNNYVHLTNNCLQKFGTNYGAHEDGNTVSYQVLQDFLDETFPQYKVSVNEHFVPRMKDLIIDSFLATKQQLNPNKRKHCFELLGYDFLIDEDFRLWLIEINTNPYFGVPNTFIANLLPKMMDDLMDMVVDPIYKPQVKPENCKLPNDFELLYCEANSVYSPNSVNVRRPFTTSSYPIPELAQVVGHKAPRQDLRYLRQYKISNLQLSTITYKKKKDVPEVNTPTLKTNNRSKSMTGSKTFNYQQYLQNQSVTQSSTLLNRTSRSRSSYKNSVGNNQPKVNTLLTSQVQQAKLQDLAVIAQQSNTSLTRKQLYLQPTVNSVNRQLNTASGQGSSGISRTPKFMISSKKNSINPLSTSTTNALKLMNGNNLTERTSSKEGLNSRSNQLRENSYMKQQQVRDQSKSDQLLHANLTGIEIGLHPSTKSDDRLIKKLVNQGKSSGQDLNQDELNRLFKAQIENLKILKNDKEQQANSVEILNLILVNAILRSLQLDYMIQELLAFLSQEKSKSQLIQSLIDLLVRFSEKLTFKFVLAKTKNTLLLVKLYLRCGEKLQVKILNILKNITCLKLLQENIQNSNKSPKMIQRQEMQGVSNIKSQLQMKSLENGLLLLQLVSVPGQLEDIDISKVEIEALLAQLLKTNSKNFDLPLIKPIILPYDANSLNLESFQNSSRRMITDPSEIPDCSQNVMDVFGSPRLTQFNESIVKEENLQYLKMKSDQGIIRTDESLDKRLSLTINGDDKYSRQTEKVIVDLNDSKDQKDIMALIRDSRCQSPDNCSRRDMINEQLFMIQNYAKKFNNDGLIQALSKKLEDTDQIQQVAQESLSSPQRYQYLQSQKQRDSSITKQQNESQRSKHKVYESPFKKSIKNSPQIIINRNESPKQKQISQYQTPEQNTDLHVKQKITTTGDLRNSTSGLQNYIQQNYKIQGSLNHQSSLSVSANQMNVSQLSTNKKGVMLSADELQMYSKTAKKAIQNSLKYAPILRKKQTLMTSSSQIKPQPLQAKIQSQLGDVKTDSKAKQIRNVRGRTAEKRQNQSTKIIKIDQPASSIKLQSNNTEVKRKVTHQYNHFYSDHVNDRDLIDQDIKQIKNNCTIDQINQKIDDIQQNLNILSQYSATNKLRITSTKVHINPNEQRKVENNNYFPQVVERINLNTLDSLESSMQDYQKEEDSNYQSNFNSRESIPNKVIMQSPQVLASEKNIQYYKRGTQVSQNRKSFNNYQKVNNYYQLVNDNTLTSSLPQVHEKIQNPNNLSQTLGSNRKNSIIDLSKQKQNNYGLYSPNNKISSCSIINNDQSDKLNERKRNLSQGKRSSMTNVKAKV